MAAQLTPVSADEVEVVGAMTASWARAMSRAFVIDGKTADSLGELLAKLTRPI